jgi:hypothetical protein
LVELAFNPGFDIATSVAEVPADSESGWALVAVPPVVDGGDGNTEVVSYFLGAEEPLESVI